MYVWFLEDPERLAQERAALRKLQESAEWLVGTQWSLADGLCLDAVIRAHSHDYEVRMTYPPLFPSVPPAVRPRNAESRWSGHQYGDRGPLCLEWGPDNWHPDVTGAQMIESAYNLLRIENPLGEGVAQTPTVAPSRHELSIGQELRGHYGRFYVGRELGSRLAALPNGAVGALKFSTQRRAEAWVAFVYDIALTGTADRISDPTIPPFLREAKGGVFLWTGVFVKMGLDPESLTHIANITDVERILEAEGYPTAQFAHSGGGDTAASEAPAGVLLLDGSGVLHMFFVFDDGSAVKLALVCSEADAATRSPEQHELSGVAVGIVGLGSVGSKVAVSLARMGIGRFFLVDHDIFLPENVVRNALDWGDVGNHKVDGVLARLGRIGARIDVDVSRLHLTGQESTAAVSGGLEELGECDLIVDATASPAVFNLLAGAATRYEKPLVWMEVYAGGVGGVVARSRPGRDPDPQTMRAVYNRYCEENPPPGLRPGGEYAVEHADGEVLVASDADVAIIAHHAARLVADTARGLDSSCYPYSMYLIGLAEWWVFAAPFHTIPIATDHFRRHDVTAKTGGPALADSIEFVSQLLAERSDAPESPA